MELWKLLGNLHPKLVQFPLVLLLFGLLFDGVGLIRRSSRARHQAHWAAAILSSAGTVLLLIAFICGIYAEIWAGRAGVPQDPIEWHEFVANIASWGFVILTAWRLLLNPSKRKALAAYTTIGLFYYVLLALTAYLGGQLVFNYGAAVTGANANTVLSLHDLNTLATRQTDLNLKYSEMMHHIFGWLTLALSGSLLAAALFPKSGQWVRRVGPALLLMGGVFLFFFGDLDLYPSLLDLRQYGDREVELHKTIALLLMVSGGAGLRRKSSSLSHVSMREGRGEGGLALGERSTFNVQRPTSKDADAASSLEVERWKLNVERLPEPSPAEELSPVQNHPHPTVPERKVDRERGKESKAIAIMALIGGGLLFTHVHTVAPYANVAAGVYIAHVVLGLVALSIGATRLLQDGVPKYRRTFATAFAVLMCVESVLLITYNEGLPWYIGYGRYNRWGPHGGTVAPYGNIRAELTYDNATQTLDVFTLDRFKDQPLAVDANTVELLIAKGGYQETVIPMVASGQSHFTATVPWMKDTAAFSARLELPVGHGSNMGRTMGYFDPWVAPLIAAVPPNEVAKYQCPMHDGIRSEKPGMCPVCGMKLVPFKTGVRTVLHDAPFDLDFVAKPQYAKTAELGTPSIGEDVLQRRLVFSPKRNGELMHDLPVVHEHPMHLTIVSSDFKFFDHVHPVPDRDGSLQIDYHFPSAGQYVLFAEYFPAGERDQVFRFPMAVGEPVRSDDPPVLPLTPATTKSVDGHPELTAELICQPRTLTAGTHCMLVFRLSDRGQPVIDLEPYMGALGHCAIISQDSQHFLHCHPEQVYPTTPDSRGGPMIAFHTEFPRPGRYKVWGQFKRAGKVIVVDFTVQVDSTLLPPKIVNFILNDS